MLMIMIELKVSTGMHTLKNIIMSEIKTLLKNESGFKNISL